MTLNANSTELRKAEKRIRIAGFAGCAMALLTVLQFFFPLFAGLSPAAVAVSILHTAAAGGSGNPVILGMPPIYFFSLLSLLLVAALTVGIFLRNTLSCVILFIYTVVAFVFSLSITSVRLLIPIFALAAILVFLFYGLLGTFDYQQYKRAEAGKNAP